MKAMRRETNWKLVRITSGYQILNNDKTGPPVAYLNDTAPGPRGSAECRANADFLMAVLARAMQNKDNLYCSQVAADVAVACFDRAAAERTELEARAERAEAEVERLQAALDGADEDANWISTVAAQRDELEADLEITTRFYGADAERWSRHIEQLEARVAELEAAARVAPAPNDAPRSQPGQRRPI